VQVDGLQEGADFVITVGSFTQNLQEEIDLGEAFD
jgi:hypothetical protein